MPGPGRTKSKAKSKGRSGKPQVPALNASVDAYVEEIDRAPGWEAIVNILCGVFELPDLTTRSGLKKVHARFDVISQRLDKAYEEHSTKEKVLGGIIGIYAKMCTDSILRNKLFAKGILSKLMPLLDIPTCRHLALRALATMTHHGGEAIRKQIAKVTTPTLIRLIEEHPDDANTTELAIVTMAHSICVVVCPYDETIPDKKDLKVLNIPNVLRVFTENMRKPTSTYYLLNHAVGLLASCTLHCSKDCKAYPPMVKLLVATLRSDDIIQRCIALGGLIRLHRLEAEEDQRILDPNKLMASIQRGFPDHLSTVMMNYGANRCDTYLTLKTSSEFQNAMMKCAQDHDLRALGLILARIILQTEFSICEGMFQTENPHNGRREFLDIGLPFKLWTDALPHCASALRTRGDPKEQDAADILQLKFLVIRARLPEAVELAKRALERSPDVAYFCYIVTLTADSTEGLRFAKKGMKCKSTSPFVRFQMMQRAVEHAANLGVCILQNSPQAGERKWEEGIAYLTSAMEDAKCYIEQAPPDNRHMKNVSYWYILLTLALQGPSISTDLRELEDAFKKLKIADDFSKHIGIPPPKTNGRLAQQTIVQLYPEAAKEWNDTIIRFSDPESRHASVQETSATSSVKIEDDLATWLDNLQMDDGAQEDHPTHCIHPKINTNKVALYRCSWCENPSAVLKKCSGCSKTRYCDVSCQRAHWRDHKKNCNTL